MAVVSGLLLTQLLGALFIIFAGVYIYFRYFLYTYWKKKGVVYLEPTTPTGNLGGVMMGTTSVGELYGDAYAKEKNNRYFGMYVMYKPSLVIADPDLIRFVLTKEFNHFHDRGMYCNEKVDPLSGHLFLLPGTKWRNLRAKLSPTFTSGKMKQMFVNVVDCGDKLTQYLRPKAESREVVEMKDIFARYSTNVIMSTAFGITCNSLEDPNNEFRYWGRKVFEPQRVWNALMAFAPQIMDFFSIPANDVGVTKFFSKAFKDTVEYREANNVSRPDFMNLIMQLMRRGYVDGDDDDGTPNISEATTGKINMLEGAAQAYVFFLAGFETSSSTITYCLYELAHNQQIQEKVMKEIDSVLKKFGGLTYESLQEMTYLHKVVSVFGYLNDLHKLRAQKRDRFLIFFSCWCIGMTRFRFYTQLKHSLETLRKYPSLPLLNRLCTEEIELPTTNLHVSKGIDVVIPVFGIHRDPEIYPEPDKFDPERFNEENIAARHPYAYLPFGEGPRICIGMRFGYAQTKVGLISMLSKYRVRLGPNTPNPLEFDPGCFVLTPKGGLELLVELR